MSFFKVCKFFNINFQKPCYNIKVNDCYLAGLVEIR